jgi:hypothetical protein
MLCSINDFFEKHPEYREGIGKFDWPDDPKEIMDLIKGGLEDAELTFHQTKRQMIARLRNQKEMSELIKGVRRRTPSGTPEDEIRKAIGDELEIYAINKLSRHWAGHRAKVQTGSVEWASRNIMYTAQSMMHGNIRKFAHKLRYGFNMSDEAQTEFLRAFYKTATDPDAIKMHKGVREGLDYLMERFNMAGGGIKRRHNFIPMRHNPASIAKVDPETWAKEVSGYLDMNIMRQIFGMKKDVPHKELLDNVEAMLVQVHGSITTGGAKSIDFGEFSKVAQKMLGNRHQEHKILIFKDAESHISYHGKYGDGTPFQGVLDYMETISDEIALMEAFGPNPDVEIRAFTNDIVQYSGKRSKADRIRRTYDIVANRNPGRQNIGGKMMQAMRDFEVITKLGGAPIAAISDTFYTAARMTMLGYPPYKSLMKFIYNLPLGFRKNRELLQHVGLGLEWAVDRARRFHQIGEVRGFNALRRVADMSTRWTGLNHWTLVAKETFQMEMLKHMDDIIRGRRVLPARSKEVFKQYGLTDEVFERLRNESKALNKEGNAYLDLTTIDDPQLASMVYTMLLEETRMAVPEPNDFIRGTLLRGSKAGTVSGEMWRTVGQFKAFPASVFLSQLGQITARTTPTGKLAYASSLIVGSTMIGSAVVQIKQLLSGKTPINPWAQGDLDSEALYHWVKDGIAQGGVFGIAGDVVINTPEYGMLSGIVSPIIGDATRLGNILIGGTQSALTTDKTIRESIVAPMGRMATQNLRGPWMLRLGLERMMLDYANSIIDPNYRTRMRKKESEMRNSKGQEWLIKPRFY